ncbi:MAG: urea ABC transporter ATP-binding protein UrtD [Betaproteobacteria bacterium]|nr:urea ABC transporter ATP-binding protein UrtD [Betaproteobacteria bacterium]
MSDPIGRPGTPAQLKALRDAPEPGAGEGGFSSGGHRVVPGEIDLSHKVILYLEDITVAFDGFKALNKLSLSIDDGELRAIIGPNGAGKTTMMDVITGKTRPDSGKAFLGQTLDLTRMSEPEIARAGIGRKFQKPSVFEQASPQENLWLACAGRKGWLDSLRQRIAPGQSERIDEVLETVGLSAERDRPAGSLSHGQKQWLEIGMLLIQDPKLLLLDEPVAGLSDEETERTAELLRRLAGNHSVVVVEHDMHFVDQLDCPVTVLHQGQVIAEGDLATVQADQRVIEVYLGR